MRYCLLQNICENMDLFVKYWHCVKKWKKCPKDTDLVCREFVKGNYINLLTIETVAAMIDRQYDSFWRKRHEKKELKYIIFLPPKKWMRHGICRGKYLAAKSQFAVNYVAKIWKKTIDATSRFKSIRGIARPRILSTIFERNRKERSIRNSEGIAVKYTPRILHTSRIFPDAFLRSIRRHEHMQYLMNENWNERE